MPTPSDLLGLLRDVCSRLDEDVSLDLLARRSGWSKFHLHRELRGVLGETPKEYTARLRLEHAAALLASTSDSILNVAVSTGFGSHEVFTRAFRRRFGCTPTQYRSGRRRGCAVSRAGQDVDLVRAVGPCLRLFHTSTTRSRETFDMPALPIELKEVSAQPILYIQRKVPRTQLSELFAECFPKLFNHCMQAGLAMAGQPVARYVSIGAGLWTVDCAIPLAEAAAGEGEMKAGELQAGPAAYSVHSGPYDQLAETNAAIEEWIGDNGLRSSGPSWECYVTDPAQHPDPADWKTEVYWPVAREGASGG